MPKNPLINKVLVIGSGPIIIGQNLIMQEHKLVRHSKKKE